MCEFCTKHGDGQKWYLNARNYSDALLADKHAEVHHYLGDSHREFIEGHRLIDKIAALPFIGKLVLHSTLFQKALQKGVFGQVIPYEDVERIFAFVTSVCLFPCICRQMSYNRKEEMYCFGVSLGNFEEKYLSRYPDVSEHLDKVSKERALELMRGMESEACFHSVWTVSTPFIATICNCNGRDCLSVKQRLTHGIRSFFKSEYVALLDLDACSGCRECMKHCNFGAVQYSPTLKKCQIMASNCFGCGVCRSACSHHAIRLVDRSAFPALKNHW